MAVRPRTKLSLAFLLFGIALTTAADSPPPNVVIFLSDY